MEDCRAASKVANRAVNKVGYSFLPAQSRSRVSQRNMCRAERSGQVTHVVPLTLSLSEERRDYRSPVSRTPFLSFSSPLLAVSLLDSSITEL